jgi:tRNA A-37 threonylcarbamoyl transferase component Bud32
MRTRSLLVTPSLSAAAIQTLDGLVTDPSFRPVKSTPRTTAGFFNHEGKELFVKRKIARSWMTSINDSIRGSSAARALRGAQILDRGGFAYPIPIAAFELREFGLVRESFLVSEALTDARILSLFALTDGRNFKRRKWISKHLAREIRRLHEAGIYTRDLQETNLMLAAQGCDITVFFVDLEDFRRVRKVSERRRLLNLIHLDRSIGRFVSRSQRLRFFYNYIGENLERTEVRRLLVSLSRIRTGLGDPRSTSKAAAAINPSSPSPRRDFTRAGTARH